MKYILHILKQITVRTLVIFIGLSFLGCNSTRSKTSERLQMTEPDYKLAVQFINDYTEYCNDLTIKVSTIEWIDNRQDLTNEFKTELRRILTEAESQDSKLGLGFDPILDAQDHPDKFEIDQSDSEYLIVKGMDWPEFRLTLKLKLVGKNWLVDGSGIINVSEDKRITR